MAGLFIGTASLKRWEKIIDTSTSLPAHERIQRDRSQISNNRSYSVLKVFAGLLLAALIA